MCEIVKLFGYLANQEFQELIAAKGKKEENQFAIQKTRVNAEDRLIIFRLGWENFFINRSVSKGNIAKRWRPFQKLIIRGCTRLFEPCPTDKLTHTTFISKSFYVSRDVPFGRSQLETKWIPQTFPHLCPRDKARPVFDPRKIEWPGLPLSPHFVEY